MVSIYVIKKSNLFKKGLCGKSMYVDPHLSEPQLSDFPDYPNRDLMRFIRFLCAFNRTFLNSPLKIVISHIRTFGKSELASVPVFG